MQKTAFQRDDRHLQVCMSSEGKKTKCNPKITHFKPNVAFLSRFKTSSLLLTGCFLTLHPPGKSQSPSEPFFFFKFHQHRLCSRVKHQDEYLHVWLLSHPHLRSKHPASHIMNRKNRGQILTLKTVQEVQLTTTNPLLTTILYTDTNT